MLAQRRRAPLTRAASPWAPPPPAAAAAAVLMTAGLTARAQARRPLLTVARRRRWQSAPRREAGPLRLGAPASGRLRWCWPRCRAPRSCRARTSRARAAVLAAGAAPAAPVEAPAEWEATRAQRRCWCAAGAGGGGAGAAPPRPPTARLRAAPSWGAPTPAGRAAAGQGRLAQGTRRRETRGSGGGASESCRRWGRAAPPLVVVVVVRGEVPAPSRRARAPARLPGARLVGTACAVRPHRPRARSPATARLKRRGERRYVGPAQSRRTRASDAPERRLTGWQRLTWCSDATTSGRRGRALGMGWRQDATSCA